MENITQKITEEQYLNAIAIINEYSKQLEKHYKEVKIKNRGLQKLHELDDLDLKQIPVRLYNVLKFNFTDIRLCDITKDNFYNARNAGAGSYNDLCNFINVKDLK
jgi:hypothetical protein